MRLPKARIKIVPNDKLGWRGGCFNSYFIFPRICIKEKYKFDSGLLEHEMTHYRQWRKKFFIHDILYFFSKNYRLDSEIEAYTNQYRVYLEDNPNYDYNWMIDSIFKKYNLDFSREYIALLFEINLLNNNLPTKD